MFLQRLNLQKTRGNFCVAKFKAYNQVTSSYEQNAKKFYVKAKLQTACYDQEVNGFGIINLFIKICKFTGTNI